MEVPLEIQAKYFERRKHDLAKCLEEFKQDHYDEIEKVGHQLKGNGSTFGHDELSHIGSQMERAAAEHNKTQIQNALEDFSLWIQDHLS